MDPLARNPWRGRSNVDAMTADAIEKAEAHAGFVFSVTQGSYQNSVSASAGTHDLGGVVDLSTRGLSTAQKARMIRALRQVGFAAWRRVPAQGPWPEHVHAVLGGHPLMADVAERQWNSYLAGRNGLANNARDDGPRLNPIPTYSWKEDDMTPADHARIEKAIERIVHAEIEKAGDTIKIDVGKSAKWSLATILANTRNKVSE